MWSYNNERPHSALKYHTPTQFMLKYGKQQGLNETTPNAHTKLQKKAEVL
jgi:hypothetical protein